MTEKISVDTRVTVETPEGVDFRFVLAGPGKRGIAYLVDLILKMAVIVIVLIFGGIVDAASQTAGIGTGVFLVTWFSMTWLYGAVCEAFWNGKTPGKHLLQLRVVRTNGTPIGWFEAFGRNLLRWADEFLLVPLIGMIQIPLCTVGVLTMIVSPRQQRLGDLIFDTMVIDETREFISRMPGITRNVEIIPRSECSGRYFVPERTLAVIERLFEGDRLIADARREEIAKPLAATLRLWLGYTEPGPDPANPSTYFAAAPKRNTDFLRRVLKTFAEEAGTEQRAAGATHRESIRPITGRRAAAVTAANSSSAAASFSDTTVDAAIALQASADKTEQVAPDQDTETGGQDEFLADWSSSL